jgi:hypothetical protein
MIQLAQRRLVYDQFYVLATYHTMPIEQVLSFLMALSGIHRIRQVTITDAQSKQLHFCEVPGRNPKDLQHLARVTVPVTILLEIAISGL